MTSATVILLAPLALPRRGLLTRDMRSKDIFTCQNAVEDLKGLHNSSRRNREPCHKHSFLFPLPFYCGDVPPGTAPSVHYTSLGLVSRLPS